MSELRLRISWNNCSRHSAQRLQTLSWSEAIHPSTEQISHLQGGLGSSVFSWLGRQDEGRSLGNDLQPLQQDFWWIIPYPFFKPCAPMNGAHPVCHCRAMWHASMAFSISSEMTFCLVTNKLLGSVKCFMLKWVPQSYRSVSFSSTVNRSGPAVANPLAHSLNLFKWNTLVTIGEMGCFEVHP